MQHLIVNVVPRPGTQRHVPRPVYAGDAAFLLLLLLVLLLVEHGVLVCLERDHGLNGPAVDVPAGVTGVLELDDDLLDRAGEVEARADLDDAALEAGRDLGLVVGVVAPAVQLARLARQDDAVVRAAGRHERDWLPLHLLRK